MTEARLVVQTSFLGDVVLTTGLIRALAMRGAVDVVVRRDAAGLLAHDPHVRRVVVYDKGGRDRGVGGFVRVVRALRAGGGYVAAYMAQGSPRSGALALGAGCRERVGFDTSRNARPFYTRVVRYRADRHHAERLWWLGAAEGAREPSVEEFAPRLYPGAADQEAARAVLTPHAEAMAAGGPLVALAPGSVWATKRWPFYAELASLVSERALLVVVGGASDGRLAAEIVAACAPGRVVDATGRLSLLASAAVIGRAALLVTNDSAPQHLASAMGTATLTIFGPTVPAFGFGPLAAGSATTGVEDLACRPCDRHGPPVCPLGHWRCMREQTPGAIAVRAHALLDRFSSPSSLPTSHV